jgi:hypothetical protein
MPISAVCSACEKLLIPLRTGTRWHEMRSWRQEGSGVLKVIISRGSGGRGYSGAAVSIPHVFSRFSLSCALCALA